MKNKEKDCTDLVPEQKTDLQIEHDDLILKHSLLQAEMKSWRDKEEARSESMRTDATNPDAKAKAIEVSGDKKFALTEEQSFKKYLAEVINDHAFDVDMNIPDYILADYLNNCLQGLGIFRGMLKHHER